MASSNTEQPPFVTNNDGVSNHTRSQSFSEGMNTSRGRLRRVVSFRALNAHLDSSESIFSDHSSLPYGFLTSFDAYNEDQVCGEGRVDQKGHDHKYQSMNTGNETYQGGPLHPASRDGWQAHVLETIVEHPSVSTTLERSISLKSRPSSHLLVSRNRYGDKIYSLDDLDIPSFRTKLSFSSLPAELRRSCRLSSSDWSFQDHLWFADGTSPAEPLYPIYFPPARCPTPPGLPSFGSPEAIRYRASYAAVQSTRGPGNDDDLDDCTCCFSGLRWLFGLSSCTAPRLPALPTGAVARATDGTIVRGRFGTRNSGHGVGAGPGAISLLNHPFHRETLPLASIRDLKRIESANHAQGQRQRQRSVCCTNVAPASPPLRVPPRTSSIRSSTISRPSSNYPVPRRVHFVDGTTPNDDTYSVPVPSYIRHPPLVQPAPIPGTSSSPSDQLSGTVTVDAVDAVRRSCRNASPQPSFYITSAGARSVPSSSAPAPISEFDVSGRLWMPEWLAECCGVFIINQSSQRDSGGAVTANNANVDVEGHQGSLSLSEFWRRGRNASRPWIPAWGCQPSSSG